MVRIQVPPAPTRALRTLVLINVGVFAAWQLAAASGQPALDWMLANFLTSTDHVMVGRVWTLLTSAFSHNILPHLFFNLFALWIFGQDVERLVGARGFVHLYLAGGITASIGHVLYGFVTGNPIAALGASGAVMAVAVVSAFLFPHRLLLLFFVIPIPQWLAVALFVVIDVVGLVAPYQDMIAHAAHLGGAVYGWMYWRFHLRGYVEARLRELSPEHLRRIRQHLTR